MMTLRKWEEKVETIDFAYQAIVRIHTGNTYAYEALLRNYKEAGFNSINEFFEEAYKEKILYRVDLLLREKAIKKYKEIIGNSNIKLFYNVDNRVLEMPDYSVGNTCKILKKYDVEASKICFEISEKHKFNSFTDIKSILHIYKQQGYNIAIDDYGTGFSGLQLLYYTEPDLIKIDRFFIEEISKDFKKKLFISNIISLAHTLGIKVIAEGIETMAEYFICREIGCDFAQGYFVQKPQLDIKELKFEYKLIKKLLNGDKRKEETTKDKILIKRELNYIKPVWKNSDVKEVLSTFKKSNDRYFFPVVNKHSEPLGIIREIDIKQYVYSPFGKEVLEKKMSGKDLRELIKKCPIVDINTSLDRILEIFSSNDNLDGIILTEESRYIGFLNVSSILKIMTEKNLAEAREQNPLSNLAGNNMINRYIEETLNTQDDYVLAYFDFDNFKPFNDKYGFRQGDRVILLFADILKKNFLEKNSFIGHVGGDDFFAGAKLGNKVSYDDIVIKLEKLVKKFEDEVINFYSKEDREIGYIISKDREENIKTFNFLTISYSVLYIPKENKKYNTNDISNIIFKLKKMAKENKVSLASILKAYKRKSLIES